MDAYTQPILQLLLAVLAGALIGFEREFRDKAAGFRTLILICVGSALFTILSLRLGETSNPTRIAANIVTGIGFLGAGVILRDGGRIVGLTTASTIWLTAALGMGIGGGHVLLSAAALAMVLIVLWIFPLFERRIDRARDTRTFEIVCDLRGEKYEELSEHFSASGLRVISRKVHKGRDHLLSRWEAYGSNEEFEKLAQRLMADAEVREFRC